MRVGMLADIYKPHVSGVTRFIEENKRALENLGHEVTIFTFGNSESKSDGVLRSPGVRLPRPGMYLGARYSNQNRKQLQAMDVVHCHHPFLSGTLARRYCLPLNIPVVFTNHTRYDLYAQYYAPFLPDFLVNYLLKSYFSSFCKSMDAVVAPSCRIKEVMRKLGVDSPIQVIPNGVDLGRFSEKVQSLPRTCFGWEEDDFLFIYAGRLANEKNLINLLKAFANLLNEQPKIRLLMVGAGPQQPELELAAIELGISHQVCFTGLVDYQQIPPLLSASNCFVTASVSEVFPLSLIEAMACGLPVIGISSPGISDIVADGETGLLADDLPAFTSNLARIAMDRDLHTRLASNARKSVLNYDLSITARKLETLYMSLAHKTKN